MIEFRLCKMAEKELLIENQRYKREIDDLDHQKWWIGEAYEDITKPKKQKDLTKYNALLIIRQGWDTKNVALDAQIDAKEGNYSQ
jgi:hypothetical protein